jgi:AsmA protein
LAVKYAVDHNLKSDAGTVTQGDVSIGKALARLTGTYQTQGQSSRVNMKVDVNDLPVDEIEAALPAVGVVLPSGSKLQGGGLSANLAIAGPTEVWSLPARFVWRTRSSPALTSARSFLRSQP